MTETPTERAARAHYLHECMARYGATAERATQDWSDPDMEPWRAQKIASMAAAIAEYEAAKAEESVAKRERAIGVAMTVHRQAIAAKDDQAMAVAISAYERVIVLQGPDAPQPRKEGA